MEETTNTSLLPLYACVRTHMDTSMHKTEVETIVIMTISPSPGAGKKEGTIKESKEKETERSREKPLRFSIYAFSERVNLLIRASELLPLSEEQWEGSSAYGYREY